MRVEMLKALNGDSFFISIPNKKKNINILVDGGTKETYKGKGGIKENLDKIIEQGLQCIIITHSDDDHIAGIIETFNKNNFMYLRQFNIKKIIYNFFDDDTKEHNQKDINKISYKQGNNLSYLLKEYRKYLNDLGEEVEIISCKKNDIISIDDISIYILTPNSIDNKLNYQKWKEKNCNKIGGECDYSTKIDNFPKEIVCGNSNIENKSSISFLLVNQEKRLLMSGDANPYDIVEAIKMLNLEKDMNTNKIKIDAIKVSHHGGDNSICEELFEELECNKYLISTSGRKYYHPRKKVLVDIWRRNSNAEFYLNYRRDIFKIDNQHSIKYYEDQNCIEI